LKYEDGETSDIKALPNDLWNRTYWDEEEFYGKQE
jgi:hypothetical protein